MEIEIEIVPMPTRSGVKKGYYTKALRKLGVSDNSSFFVSFNGYKSIDHLRGSLHSAGIHIGIKTTTCYEFKFQCEKCGDYAKKKELPICSNCKLVDKGVRIWRID